MAKRKDMLDWLVEALKAHNGRATIAQLCKYIWEKREDELRRSGNLFYTWQYDIRWAARELRIRGIMRAAKKSPKGIWELLT